MSHTKEPWLQGAECLTLVHLKSGVAVARTSKIEDARRIVACVNALAGAPTEWLESYTAGNVENVIQENARISQQCGELLAALKEYIAAADASMCADDDVDDVANMLRFGEADKSARLAIAKAEAKP